MANLFSDAECTSIFRAVTGHPLCGPSEFNGVAPVVVTPAVPGPGVRIPSLLLVAVDCGRLRPFILPLAAWPAFRARWGDLSIHSVHLFGSLV